MKIFIDGAFGGRTAALRQPYSDDPHNTGMLIHTTEQLTKYVQLARQSGQTVAVHAIGDLAIELIVDIFCGISTTGWSA
ncbi:amidohydrolase family protein [Lysinibacillus sp. MHQ-1]|nr:amidohydrolase family protein [Lysinibacillus sp. MHQ-1]